MAVNQFNNFVSGEWVAGESYSPNIDSSNLADMIGEYTQGDAAQMDAAARAAQAPFPAWSNGGIQARRDALDKIGSDLGPVSSRSQLEQDIGYVAVGKAGGATLATGGGRTACHTGSGNEGFFIASTLFTDTTAAMRINREEIFGPVVSVIRVKDYEAALATANDTPFGLSSGIATTSLKYATHFKRHSQAGMVMVNLPTAGVDYHVPFGGRKGSSYGPREQGKYAQEFFTTVKTAYTLA